MNRSVVIDCYPSSVARYRRDYAIVAIDVIRATTMAITSAASGRPTFFAESLESAWRVAATLENPLMAGELAGDMPEGFHLNNSPAELLERDDLDRPVVLLSTAGTQLLWEASQCEGPAYAACFRNHRAVSRALSKWNGKIAVIGAGSRNEFREEDQMCCALVAEQLLQAGFRAESPETEEIVRRWAGAPLSACLEGNSVAYLRRSGQLRDLDFIVSHVNDLDSPFLATSNRILAISTETEVLTTADSAACSFHLQDAGSETSERQAQP